MLSPLRHRFVEPAEMQSALSVLTVIDQIRFSVVRDSLMPGDQHGSPAGKKRSNFVLLLPVAGDHLYLKRKIANAFKAFAVHPPWRQPVHIRLK